VTTARFTLEDLKMAEKKYTMEEVSGILDPMLSDNFLLSIPNIPGATNADRLLRIQCQTAVKPGMTVEEVTVALFGHELRFAGRNTTTHDLPVQYIENYQGQVTLALEAWSEVARSLKTQTGSLKRGGGAGAAAGADGYARDGELHILSPAGESILVYKIYGMWPSVVPELSFTGESATAITLSASFKFDWYELTQSGEGAVTS
jgi:hypothetical protein